MSNKRKPTPIAGEGFRNSCSLTHADIKKLIVNTPEDASSLFPGWERGVAIGLVCHLSNDNQKISNCTPIVLGDMFPHPNQRKLVSLNAAWQKLPNLQISLGTIDCANFKFKTGMVSDFIDSAELDFYFISDGNRLSDADCQANDLFGFCVRLHIVPSTQEYAKLFLVMYPDPLADLIAGNPLAEDGRFPGLKLHSGEYPFLPLSRTLLGKAWGSPLAPAIITGSVDTEMLPTGTHLKAAISATLRLAVKPEIKAGHSTLKPRWSEIRESGESALISNSLELIWPQQGDLSAAQQGRTASFLTRPPPRGFPLFT